MTSVSPNQRFESSSDPSLNRHLNYPNNIGRSLNESVTDEIRKYHTDYNNNPPNRNVPGEPQRWWRGGGDVLPGEWGPTLWGGGSRTPGGGGRHGLWRRTVGTLLRDGGCGGKDAVAKLVLISTNFIQGPVFIWLNDILWQKSSTFSFPSTEDNRLFYQSDVLRVLQV